MARKEVADEGLDVSPQARVWGSMETRVNLGDYDSITFAVGVSRPVRNSTASIRAMARKIAIENEDMINEAIERYKELSVEKQGRK